MAPAHIGTRSLSEGGAIGLIVALSVLGPGLLVILAIAGYKYYWRYQLHRQLLAASQSSLTSEEGAAKSKRISLSYSTTTAEDQRTSMIRKSLASRASYQTETPIVGHETRQANEEQGAEDQLGKDLRHDWKEWEARIQRERGLSVKHHPALGEATPNLSAIGAKVGERI